MDSAHLVYSTSHLMTHAPIGGQDVAVLASRPGDDGETVLRYPAAATGPGERPGRVRAGPGVTSSWDASTGDLRLNYTHQGLTRILVTPAAGGQPLLLLAVDDAAAAVIWRTDTAAGPVLASGPALVRTADGPGGSAGAHRGHQPRPRRWRSGRPVRSPRCGGTAGRSR